MVLVESHHGFQAFKHGPVVDAVPALGVRFPAVTAADSAYLAVRFDEEVREPSVCNHAQRVISGSNGGHSEKILPLRWRRKQLLGLLPADSPMKKEKIKRIHRES
jgi:hypothetical protein